MAQQNNADKQWQHFYENQQKLATDEYTGNVYDTYATAYNNQRLSIGDMIALSDRQAEQLQSIEDSLIENYGFSMDAWPLIEKSTRQQRAEIFQEWINEKGYTGESFNEALSIIFQESRRYFELQYQRGLMEVVMQAITKRKYPARVKLFGEMTEEERSEIPSKRGPKLDKDVPQEDIASIVNKCIKDRSSRRFINQEGERKGKANKNQIKEYILNNHPEFVKGEGDNKKQGVVPRTIGRRIDKALPDDMT